MTVGRESAKKRDHPARTPAPFHSFNPIPHRPLKNDDAGPTTAGQQRGSAGTGIKCAVTRVRSEEHTSELQSRLHLVCRLLLEKKKEPTTSTSRHPTQTF